MTKKILSITVEALLQEPEGYFFYEALDSRYANRTKHQKSILDVLVKNSYRSFIPEGIGLMHINTLSSGDVRSVIQTLKNAGLILYPSGYPNSSSLVTSFYGGYKGEYFFNTQNGMICWTPYTIETSEDILIVTRNIYSTCFP